MKIVLALLLPLFILSTGCLRETGKSGASSVNKTSGSNSSIPVITWEFNTEETESGPGTEAIMVIHGNPDERLLVSSFFGTEAQVTEMSNPSGIEAGALIGFRTFWAGVGQEVVVRYNEHDRTLEVLSRRVSEEGGPESFTVIETVRLKDRAAKTGQ